MYSSKSKMHYIKDPRTRTTSA